MEQSQSPVKEGDILAGKYRIERVLGVGGMGVVVAAHHIALDQHVAIKFLLPDAMAVPDVVSRFGREARAAAKIQSEHVARVIDVGTLETGSPYMVMEYLEGQDLAALLDSGGPLSVEKAVTYVLQACEAIAAAHALGIIHRDLKPANLFLAKRQDRQPIVKVLDFGISKAKSTENDAQITKTSAMMGSPMYMSPEQMKATKNVDVRSDIWALGVILYELVTNDRPFAGESIPEVIANVLSEPARPIQEIRPDVPVEYARLVHKCLEKRPEQRFQSVAEFAEALAAFAPVTQRMSIERIHRVLGTQMNIQMPPMQMVGQVPTLAGPGPAAAPPTAPSPAFTPATVPDGTAQDLGTQRSPGIEPAQTGSGSVAGAATGAAWTNTQAGAARPFWQKPSVAAAAIIVVMAGVGVAAMVAMGKGGGNSGTAQTAATTAATQAAAAQQLPPATPTDTPAATTAAPTATAPAATTAATINTAHPTATATGAKPPGTATATATATTTTPPAATTTTPPAQTTAPPATTNTNPLSIPIIH